MSLSPFRLARAVADRQILDRQDSIRDSLALKVIPADDPSRAVYWCGFFLVASFVYAIGPGYVANPVTVNTRRDGSTHCCYIFCEQCLSHEGPLTPGHKIKVKGGAVKPAFMVYSRYDAKNPPTFLITARDICEHGRNNWHISEHVPNLSYEIFIDCGPGVAKLNAKNNIIKDRQPLKPLGRWMLKRRAFSVAEKEWYYRSCLPESTQRRWREAEENTSSLNDLLGTLPGHKVVRAGLEDPSSVCTYVHNGKERDVVSLTWVAPWAVKAWTEADYIQLDCSFRGTKPYAYCVPQAIIGNEAVPLGFIMTPSECAETYRWWLADLQAANCGAAMPKKIILSDEGAALRNFTSRGHLRHYFCHRHLIQKFGAHGLIGELVTQALRTQANETYQALRPQLLANAQDFLANGEVTQELYDKFVKFLSVEFPHGVWHRAADGVARCSNHAESFHGHINEKIKGLRKLTKRLQIMADYIQVRFAQYSNVKSRRTHVMRLLNGLIRHHKKSQRQSCNLTDCLAYQQNLARRCRLDSFPCRHCASYWMANCAQSEFRKRPLPDISPLGVRNTIHVEDCRLFSIQATDKFKAYYRRKKRSTAPRSDVPDEDEARNSPETLESVLASENITIESIPEYSSACNVLSGVLHIADQEGHPPPRNAVTLWLMLNWTRALTAFLKLAPSRADIQRWIARFTTYWWSWAKDTSDVRAEPTPFAEDSPPRPPEAEKSTKAAESQDPMPVPTRSARSRPRHKWRRGVGFATPAEAARDAMFQQDRRGLPIPLIPRKVARRDSSGADIRDPTISLMPRMVAPADWSLEDFARFACPASDQDWDPGMPLPIPNLGNTCFSGAALQCLYHILPLSRFFLSHVPYPSRLPALYQRLLLAIATRHMQGVTGCLSELITYVAQKASLERFGEHDLHEFLVYLLDILKEELGSIDGFHNVVTEFCTGLSHQMLHCPQCGRVSLKSEAFRVLSLPLPEDGGSVSDALRLFSTPEELDEGNAWKCHNCGQMVCATKTTFIDLAPKLLIIHFIRHRYTPGRPVKLGTRVNFDHNLALACRPREGWPVVEVQYRLKGVAEHVNDIDTTNVEHGHFVAHVQSRTESGLTWYRCSDSNVTESSDAAVLAAEAYVLFYDRCEPPRAQPSPDRQ
jgi:ubiquitin C-terminal hydrolase